VKNVFVLALCLIAVVAQPGPTFAANYSLTGVDLMYGRHYHLGAPVQSTLTFNHFSTWEYGDNFLFVDVAHSNQGGTSVYGEFHPRFSISKISGRNLSHGVLKDVAVAGTLEFGEGLFNRLYGVGFDLDVPKFSFFNVNLYVRDNPDLHGQTYQITPYWALPFKIGKAHFSFEGFVDIAGGEGASSRNILAQPKLLYDVGAGMGVPNRIMVGIEYAYWKNKYGVKGVTDSFPQFMVRWNF